MATIEEVDRILDEMGTPGSGGVNIYDKNGNKIGNTSYSESVNKAMANNQPLYLGSDGKWTTTMPEASITLDKETGKIKVSAPESFYERESFKQRYADSSLLETLSRMYKADKDAKYPDPYPQDPDNPRQMTVEEIVEEYYTKPIKDYSKSVAAQEEVRASIKNATNNPALAKAFTELDFMYMSQSATEDTANDGSIISIPKTLNSNFFQAVQKAEGFNADRFTITRGALNSEAWNLGKMSEDDLVEVFTDIAIRMAEIKNKVDITAEDANEYARLSALLAYITDNEPKVGFWREKGLDLKAHAGGLLATAHNLGGGALSLAESGANLLNFILTPWLWGKAGTGEGASTWLKEDYLASKQEDAEIAARLELINHDAAMIMQVTELATTIAGTILMGKWVSNAVTNTIAAAATWGQLGAIAEAVGVGTEAGFVTASGATNLTAPAVANALRAEMTAGLGAIPTTSSLLNSAQSILKLSQMNPATLANSVNTLIQAMANSAQTQTAVNIIGNAVKTINGINKAATAANIISQIAVDTLITDPVTFRMVVEDSDPEARGELLKTLAFDAAMYTIGFGAAAITSKFPGTQTARTMNARIVRKEAQGYTAVVSARDKLKSAILRDADYIDHVKSGTKRQVGQLNKLINRAFSNVGKAGYDSSMTKWEQTLDIEKSIANYAAVQDAVDAIESGNRAIYKQMFNKTLSPVLSSSVDKLVKVEDEIVALEKKYGLNKKENYLKNAKGQLPSRVTWMSQDYRGNIYRKWYIEDSAKIDGKMQQGMQTELDAINEFNPEFKKKYPELAAKLEASLPMYAEAYASRDDWLDKMKLLDKDEQAERIASGRWSHGYIRSQRLQEFDETQRQRVELNVLEYKNRYALERQSYSFGSTDHYADMFNVFMGELADAAQIKGFRENMINLTGPDGVGRKITHTGDEIKRVETVKKLKGSLHKQVIDGLRPTGEKIKTGNIGDQLGDLITTHMDYLNMDAQARRDARKVTKAQTKEIRVTGVDRARVFNELPDEEVTKYLQDTQGFTFTNIEKDEYDALVNPYRVKGDASALALRKEIRTSLNDNANFILTTQGLGGADEARVALRSMPKIKTSSYMEVMGYKNRKDIDPTIKPYLSEKNGFALDDSLVWAGAMPETVEDRYGNGSFAKTEDEVLDYFYSLIAQVDAADAATELTYDNFLQVIAFDPTLPNRLDRIALNKSGFKDSEAITKMVEARKRSETINAADQVFQGDLDEVARLASLDAVQQRELLGSIDDLITEYIYTEVSSNSAADKVINSLIADATNKDAAREYVVLSELYSAKKELGGAITNAIESKVRQSVNAYNVGKPKAERIDTNDAVKKFNTLFEDAIYDRRNQAMHVLEAEDSTLIDKKGIYAETNRLNKEISESFDATDIVAYTNENGLVELAQVDPTVADVLKYTPNYEPRNVLEAYLNSKAHQTLNRSFRLGATGVNVKSWTNQWLRDPMNEFVGTGAVAPASFYEKKVAEKFGQQIADEFRLKNNALYQQFKTQAQATGLSVGEVATGYVAEEAYERLIGSTETTAFRTNQSQWDLFKSKGEKLLELAETPNEIRENGLRRAGFEKTLYDALSQGKDLKTARILALRAATDATTNFGRQTYHLQALTRTTPYLRSGINGDKSFWRLMSIDPVGVTTRLMTGIILPLIAATVAIMTDDEARNYYKTLNEYEKDNNLIYKVNGRIYSLPIPQELSKIATPIRHVVESLFNGNRHAFWELALNDAIGLLPYDFTGIVDIDNLALSEDPTLLDRIGSMGLGLLADVLSPINKSAFELVYGIDPYTGKKIDKSKVYIDEDGVLQVMDSTTSEFAKAVASVTGWSPSVVSTIVTNFVGQAGRDILDSIVSLAQWVVPGGEKGSPLLLLERALGGIGDVFTVNDYDRTAYAWTQEVKALTAEKDELMKDYLRYSEQIVGETNTAKRQKLIANRNDLIAPYIEKVKTMVERFQTKLGGKIDSYRFASVVALMNFYSPSSNVTSTEDLLRAEEDKQRAKELARMTIQNMNVADSPVTDSLLGYLYTDENGEQQVAYYTPLEILNAQSIIYGASDTHQARIEKLLDDNGITRTKMYYDSGYMDASKSERKKIAAEWNTKVLKILYPYISEYGAKTVISNQEMVDLLSRYIFVDNPFQAKAYLQKIFGD